MINQQKISGICLSNGKLSWATESGINSYHCKKEFVPFAPFVWCHKNSPSSFFYMPALLLWWCIFILRTRWKSNILRVFKTSNLTTKHDRKYIFSFWEIRARSLHTLIITEEDDFCDPSLKTSADHQPNVSKNQTVSNGWCYYVVNL